MAANFHGDVESPMLGEEEQDPLDCASVQVAIPVGCMVISSLSPEVLGLGDCVIVFPYPPIAIQKFVFSKPVDNALELPQAFFHFMAYISGGRQLVWDLQGREYEDGSVLLVDPWLVQRPHATQTDTELLRRLHPVCNSLCLMFIERLDPPSELQRSPTEQHHCINGSHCMTQ